MRRAAEAPTEGTKETMRIGEFARKNGVTVRALRHYEELGLLRPYRVDDFTGYRYYQPAQSARLWLIGMMKRLGFSLGEVADMLRRSVLREEMMRVLDEKLIGVRHEMDCALLRRQGLEAFQARISECPAGVPIDMKEVSVMTMDDIGKNLPDEDRAQMLYERAWERSCANNTPLSMLVMDLDHMQHINEAFGREAGDEVLDRIFNIAVRESMRFHDSKRCEHSFAERGRSGKLFRKGGDEFTMTLEGADAEAAHALAQSICDKVRQTDFSYIGCTEPMTVSIGVADRRHGARSYHELIHQAETAMMDAKSGGRDRAVAYRP
ncbi:MAG: diguanylate cyclase [Clostridiales bacterium]|nr:diguanylate cyclase [Clostridiales bacterium]